MTARWTPVASLVAVTLAPGTIPPCASVTVPWSVAVDCAHDGAVTRSSITKAAERDRTVFIGIKDSSLTGRGADAPRRQPAIATESPGSGQGLELLERRGWQEACLGPSDWIIQRNRIQSRT